MFRRLQTIEYSYSDRRDVAPAEAFQPRRPIARVIIRDETIPRAILMCTQLNITGARSLDDRGTGERIRKVRKSVLFIGPDCWKVRLGLPIVRMDWAICEDLPGKGQFGP